MKKKSLRAAILAGLGALVVAGVTTGVVMAGGNSRAASDSVEETVASRSHATAGPELGKTSKGVHIYNNTLGNMVLAAEAGDNAGVPPVGATLSPGTGYHDFEVVFRAANKTTVAAVYVLYDPAGNKIGEAKISMTVDEFDDVSVSSQFMANDGSSMPLKTSSYSDGYQVVSSTGGSDIDSSDPLAATLSNNFCNNSSTLSKCTFVPSGKSAGTQMKLLAMSYNQPGGGNTESTLSVESGYSAMVTDSWSVTGSVQLGLEGVLSAGIQATYGQSVSNETTFTSSESIPIESGYTGYIWGKVPVTNFTGTLQIKLGSATYNIENTQVGVPDASRQLSGFSAGTYAGDDPLHSPDNPPSDARALK